LLQRLVDVWNEALLTMPLISGAGVSIWATGGHFWIFTATQISQNV